MKEWVPYKLKEITTKIGSGSTPTGGKEAYYQSGITLVRSLNIYDFVFELQNLAFINKAQAKKLNGVTIEKDDILLNITGASVGRCTIIPEYLLPARVNQHVSIIRCDKEKVDAKFLLYCINSTSYKDALMSIADSGATREALTKDDIEKFQVLLPSLPLQQRIASILSAYDDLVEVNNQRIKLLEETARELYKEWFVRMRFPGYKKAKFVKGIPKTWTIESLKDHITIVRGKSYTSEEIDDNTGDHAFINLKNMKRNGGFRLDGTKFFSGKFKKEQVVLPGDIVMAVTDMTQDRLIVGRVARVPLTEHKEYVISLDIVKIVSTKLSNDFIYSTLRFNYYGEHIAQFANGTNVLHLNPELLRKESILIPDEDLIKSFVQTVKPMFELVDVLAIEIEQLRQIRDRLLPRLISGKLVVKEIIKTN